MDTWVELCWFSVKWNWQGRRVCKPREVIVAIPSSRVPLPCSATPGECRQFDAQSCAQIEGRVVGRLFRGLRPQIQRVARPAALETVEHVLLLIRAEAPTRPTRAAVQRTRSAMLRRRDLDAE